MIGATVARLQGHLSNTREKFQQNLKKNLENQWTGKIGLVKSTMVCARAVHDQDA